MNGVSLFPDLKFYWNTKPSGLKIWPRIKSSLVQLGVFLSDVRQSMASYLQNGKFSR